MPDPIPTEEPMPSEPTDADRAAALEIYHAATEPHTVNHIAVIIAEHMAPERARVEKVKKVCRDGARDGQYEVNYMYLLHTLRSPPSETEEPTT